MSELPPVRRQVVVPVTCAAAFEVFTAEIGSWWPVAELSVHGEHTTVGFENGRLVEHGPDGAEAVWGTILDWQPPTLLRMTWHPGGGPAKASEVEVRFAEVTEALTLVTVEHRGWERFADPAAARTEYDHGWPQVLTAYSARTTSTPTPEDGPMWLALMHTPGPALPPGEPVFTQPDFAEHLAFLRRLDERGVLVAAGSLDKRANGMTLIRLSDPTDTATYTRLAQDDDNAVVRGLLQVLVQPWHVALEGNHHLKPI